jgi:hypothetical protein
MDRQAVLALTSSPHYILKRIDREARLAAAGWSPTSPALSSGAGSLGEGIDIDRAEGSSSSGTTPNLQQWSPLRPKRKTKERRRAIYGEPKVLRFLLPEIPPRPSRKRKQSPNMAPRSIVPIVMDTEWNGSSVGCPLISLEEAQRREWVKRLISDSYLNL